MKCPKCYYIRNGDEDNPDWQCPKCGIAYGKFSGEMLLEDPPKRSEEDLPEGRKDEEEFSKYLMNCIYLMILLSVIVNVFSSRPMYVIFFLSLSLIFLLAGRMMVRTGFCYGSYMEIRNKMDNPVMYGIEVSSAFIGSFLFFGLSLVLILK